MYGHPDVITLAENPRTATKAAIKRASARARSQMRTLDREMEKELERIYTQAVEDLRSYLHSRAGGDNTLRLEVMRDLLDQAESRLNVMAKDRNTLMNRDLFDAADLGVQPFIGMTGNLTQIADNAVRFVTAFVAEDGLQLSDRIWKMDNQARQVVTEEIQRAVIQGHSASQAAQDLLSRGLDIPADLKKKMTAAQWDKIHAGIKTGIFSGEESAYANALRVMRTEINRAHGEAYMASAFEHPDVVGTRFLLSPAHPRTDICDMHAKVNLYGLGKGVYPKGKNPWPAHPNTLSFVEVVFADEVTEEDRLGKINRIDWLKSQSRTAQADILGRNKAAALRADLLTQGQINTPWKVLKKRYVKDGIDIEKLIPPAPAKTVIRGTLVTGIDPGEFSAYVTEAMQHAPDSIHKIIDMTVKPDSIRVIPSGQSYFQWRSITLSQTAMRPRLGFESKYCVYRHEYGHFIDHWALSPDGRKAVNPISFTPNAGGGLRDSLKGARKTLYANSKAGKEKIARLRQEMIDRMDNNLADLFGALSGNRIGWGHSKGYLARPGFSETEAFANLFDIYSRKDLATWNFVQEELPELAADFVALLERLTK